MTGAGSPWSRRTAAGAGVWRWKATVSRERLTYQWNAGLEEWFINGNGGLEHGFTVSTRPAGARAGEPLAIISTGLGQTTPPLATGEIPVNASVVTAGLTLTIGGQNAPVAGTTVIPGFPGFYVTLFAVPANVPAGTHPVVLRMGGAVSNMVTMAVR